MRASNPTAIASIDRARPTAAAVIGRLAVRVAALVAVTAASIAFGLSVTPAQQVRTLGQTVEVGATAPALSASGPGEIVLFGQSLPTQVGFVGPVRPRVALTDIRIDAQVEDAFAPPGREAAAAELGEALAGGWRRYFAWQSLFVAGAAVVLLGAIAGWRRHDGRRTLAIVVGGLVAVEAINLGAIMVTAFTAPGVLRDVGSLNELVGRERARPIAAAPGPERGDVQAVVIGDSTAAGLGGPALADATPQDEACERSAFAFAETLARVNEWTVANLACSGATIEDGVLGPQQAGGRRLAPQLAEAKRAVDAEVVVVNIGANDLDWSTVVFLCAATGSCDDRAQAAYFQRSLDAFTQDYYELLRQLTELPNEPLVLINGYYAPFSPELDCLSSIGLTRRTVGPLLERLDALNAVLRAGAGTFGFRSVTPDFTGHELCTEQSYVQDVDDPAPLHPNARGHLAIALADERALLEAG